MKRLLAEAGDLPCDTLRPGRSVGAAISDVEFLGKRMGLNCFDVRRVRQYSFDESVVALLFWVEGL
jgi:hypothetical protein